MTCSGALKGSKPKPKPRSKPKPSPKPVPYPSIGYTIFYGLIKNSRRQGEEDFWVSRRWRDGNCSTGPTDEEAHRAAAKWGYDLVIDELDGYHFTSRG